MDEFKGRTEAEVSNLKDDVRVVDEKIEKVSSKVEAIDRRIWFIIILLITTLALKAPDLTSAAIKGLLSMASW